MSYHFFNKTGSKTDPNFVNCGRGGKTTSAFYFSNEYLKAVKNELIEGCVNNFQIKNINSIEKVQTRSKVSV